MALLHTNMTGAEINGIVSRMTLEELGAIGVHHTAVDKDGAWDAGANLKRLGDSPSKDALRAMHAWVDPSKDAATKGAYKLPHHDVSADGKVGAANMAGCAAAMGRLNGGGLDIPAPDKAGVHAHLAAHYKDAGKDAPDLKAGAQGGGETIFQGELFSASHDEISFAPQSADDKNRTVDVVWYGGQTVPRYDAETDTDYMLRLNMAGCRMARLNAGAPVFDCHMTGTDFKSIVANQAGAKAQRGSVVKAWADGAAGKATLQFGVEGENKDTDQLWSGIASGRIRNLSFGTWIYSKQPVKDANGNGTMAPHPSGKQAPVFEATDWEPFEVSAITVPADFSTQFLSALGADRRRATSPNQERTVMEETTQAGAEARNNQAVLDAARTEGATLERQRVAEITTLATNFKCQKLGATLIASGATVKEAEAKFAAASEIRTIGTPHLKHGITTEFLDGLIDTGTTLDAARASILQEIEKQGSRGVGGQRVDVRTELSITRDQQETFGEQMTAALLLRHRADFFGPTRGAEVAAETRRQLDLGKQFRGLRLIEMAREYLEVCGVRTRGMGPNEIAAKALVPKVPRASFELFEGGAESTSDFPGILANVANKTLVPAYLAYPQTFRPLARQVTAPDFKPINRAFLSDLAALPRLNEKGEYHRAILTDGNVSYSLATYGEVVALTRKTIINDDLQAFTRTPAELGVAASRMESDVVWGIVLANPSAVYMGDKTSVALFAAGHKNFQTGAPSAFAVASLATGRTLFRQQTGPQGTPLNLTPRYLVTGTALETTVEQTIYPMQLAVTAVTAGVPVWVRSLVPVVEPRLDALATYGATAWYLFADPADVAGLEYAFLEGQEGVFMETRQGFDVDGIEIKARHDFGAAAIDYRGIQRSNGAA